MQQPFNEVLLKHIDPWLQQHGALVTVLCGMVGSPGGWHLVPHLPAPASLMQLTEHCHRLTDFTIAQHGLFQASLARAMPAAMT